eukprot:TRINITY_DN10483_c0_g1_i2.p1 TRINITY_DN10483_c0_g1~~TRINITY_DN10483_c0_g1_i2.p1  ORF type:complete len:368 (-),score=53.57 TRINITY_DN10483_c0_g1_i2:8-1111(-)
MSHHKIVSVVAVVAVWTCQVVIANPIKPDFTLLTNFTAELMVNSSRLVYLLRAKPSKAFPPSDLEEYLKKPALQAHAWVQADVLQERLKVVLAYKGQLPTNPQMLPPKMRGLAGLQDSLRVELLFDGLGDFVHLHVKRRDVSRFGDLSADICVKFSFAHGLIPPPDLVKAKLAAMKPDIAKALRVAPHVDGEISGEQVAVLQDGPWIVGMKHNAVPFAVWLSPLPPNTDITEVEPPLSISKWAFGSGVMTPLSCDGRNEISVLAQPEVSRALEVIDLVTATLQNIKPLHLLLSQFPRRLSLLARNAVQAELDSAHRENLHATPDNTIEPGMVAMLAAVFGTSLAAVSMMLTANRNTLPPAEVYAPMD